MTRDEVGEIGCLALRRHPRFGEAVEADVAGIVAQKLTFRPVMRWLTNDVGRSSVLARAASPWMGAASPRSSGAEVRAAWRGGRGAAVRRPPL